jgi:hypothetical protein
VTSGRALLTLAIVVLSTTPVGAVSFTLNERQVQEATEVGERSITRDTFGEEWTVKNVTVMTPFHRVALAARHAAFRKEPLKPRDRQRVLKEQQDRLVFWVALKGSHEDFARFYTPKLIAGPRELQATFAQNERTPARGEDGKFVAHCVYGFPTKLLAGVSKVVLVIKDADGHDVTSVPVDLSSMR